MKIAAVVLGSVLTLGMTSFAQANENFSAPPAQDKSIIGADQNSEAYLMERRWGRGRWGWGHRWGGRWGGWRGWHGRGFCYWHPYAPRCMY